MTDHLKLNRKSWTTPWLGILKAKSLDGPFKKKPLVQPQQFGLNARTARWDSLAQILQEDVDITAVGRRAAKSLPGQISMLTHPTAQIRF